MPVATPPPHVHAHSAARPGIEQQIVGLINRVRRRRGLAALSTSRRLAFVAGAHSLDMARHHELSHDSSNGETFAQRVWRVTNARVIGETIAEVTGGSARSVVRAWMHSPPHRAELLSPSFRVVGVGCVRQGRSRIVTADFASS